MHREEITSSVEKGLEFFARSLPPSGFWHTFQSSQGESDVWVSAYVIREIGALLRDKSITYRVSKALLAAQSSDGGWGYKQNYVSDADSTATVCQGLSQLAHPLFSQGARVKALQFLIDHLDTWNTGFCTFRFETLEKILPLERQSQAQGWIEPHIDVSTNVCDAILQIGDEALRESCAVFFQSLASSKNIAENSWEAYWWSTDFLCTYYMIRLNQKLLSSNPHTLDARVKNIADQMSQHGFWESQFAKKPCIFTTSIALRCLLWRFDSYADHILKAASAVISLQKGDGSWDSQPILVIPTPNALSKRDVSGWRIDTPGYPNVLSDDSRVLVTAVAVKTLYEVHQTLQSKVRRVRGEMR